MIKQKLAKLGILLALSFAFTGTVTTSTTAAEKAEQKKVENDVEFSLDTNNKKGLKLFKVNGVKVFKLEDGYKFVAEYESEEAGDYILRTYDEDWSTNLTIKGGIKKGKNELKVKMSKEGYQKVLDKNSDFGIEIILDEERLTIYVSQEEALKIKDKAVTTEDASVDESVFTGKINYNFWYEGKDFQATKVSAYKIKNGIKFELAYTSKISGDYFYGSYGEDFGFDHVIKGGLKKGKHTAKFIITEEEFAKASKNRDIVFSIREKSDWINVNIPMEELKGIESMTEISNDDAVDKGSFTGKIKFNFDYKGKAFRVNKVSAYRVKKGIKFEVAYDSTMKGDYLYSSWGDEENFEYRILGGIKNGKNTAKFIVSNEDFKKALKNRGISFSTEYKGKYIEVFIAMDELRGVESMKKISTDQKVDKSVFSEKLSFDIWREGKRYNGNDFVVKSFMAKKLKEGVKFIVNYESKEACDYGYFSSGENNTIFQRTINKGIKKGKGTAKFKITKEEFEGLLKDGEGISFRVDIKEKPLFIFVDKSLIAPIKSVKKIEKDESVDISMVNQALEFETQYKGNMFKLNSLQIKSDKKGYKIEGNYESEKAGDYSYYAAESLDFDKKVNKGIKKGKGNFSFVISEKELKKAEKGLVISPDVDEKEEIIFFVYEYQLRNLLEN